MNIRHRSLCFLAFVLLLAAIVPGASAFTLSSTKVDPPGYQPAGTPMTVTFTIDFPVKGNDTFPSEDELTINTNLDNARWVPALVLNGAETSLPSKTGRVLVLPGWYVSYPSPQNVQVRGTLTGTMPEDSAADRLFLKVQHISGGSAVMAISSLEMPSRPATTAAATPKATTKKPVTKTPAPLPTTTQQSSPLVVTGIIAACGAALLAARRI